MEKKKKIEIMAPVGSFESLGAAIRAGADSIYFGIGDLNMRARSSINFSLSDLKKITSKARKNNVLTYLVVNTLLYDNDIRVAKKIVDAAKKRGVDAIIAFDFAVINYCNEINIPVQISVQFSVSNYESLKFFSQFTNRVVLARELTLEQIKTIHNKIKKEELIGSENRLMEIEIFGHGALCIAQSGRCWMSLYQHNASANRGLCLQGCRRKYRVIEEETKKELIIDNHYVMSAADICTIDFLDKIIDSGVSVLKIEGRGRSPEYVHTVVKTYRKALKDIKEGGYSQDKIDKYFKELESVFHRGLSHGNYFLGKEIGAYSTSYGSMATTKKIYRGRVIHFFSKIKVAEILLEAGSIKVGDGFLITGPKVGVVLGVIDNIRLDDESSCKRAPQKSLITILVPERVYKNDRFYIIKKRKTESLTAGAQNSNHIN